MVKACPVVNSQLWKSLRKGLSKAERAKLLKELRKVEAACPGGVEYDAPKLVNAFVWRSTPQGYRFWQEHDEAAVRRHWLG